MKEIFIVILREAVALLADQLRGRNSGNKRRNSKRTTKRKPPKPPKKR